MSQQTSKPTLPLIASPARLIVFLVIIAALVAAAFGAGTLVRAPSQTALDEVDQKVPVTYAVENRIVTPPLSLPGQLVPGGTQKVLTLLAGDRQIITKPGMTAGQRTFSGALLAEVSGRPQIAIPASVPLYRDLVLKSTGADVSAFQAALRDMGEGGVSVTGMVDEATLAGAKALFSRIGETLPGGDSPMIPWADFVPVPIGAVVVAASSVGTVLQEGTGMITLQTTADTIKTRASVIEATKLAKGTTVIVRAGDKSADSSVVNVGPFTNDDTTGGGHDVSVAVPKNLSLATADTITVSLKTTAKPVPAVPLVALRQDSQGQYVELASKSRSPAEAAASEGPSPVATNSRRVYVKVVAQQDGWAGIQANARLPVGTEISVAS